MTSAARRTLAGTAFETAKRKGVRAQWIAARTGVTRQAVSSWKYGLSIPSDATAALLRAAIREMRALPDLPPPRVHVPESAVERLWRRIRRTRGCWLWTGQRTRAGYGILAWYGRMTFAHQAVLSLDRRWDAPGTCVLHACGKRLCVRPDHLVLSTPAEAMRLRIGGVWEERRRRSRKAGSRKQ